MEVAGIEPAPAQICTPRSGVLYSFEQGKDGIRQLPTSTATDRNSVFFRCSCVFFASRKSISASESSECRPVPWPPEFG